MISIKTPREIKAMVEGGKILAKILRQLKEKVKPGMTTSDLNIAAEALMAQYNVAPSFKGYRGYPAVICTSVNEEVVHAIPGKRVLNAGDKLCIDAGVLHQGLHTDSAVAIFVGGEKAAQAEVKKFVRVTEEALERAIAVVRPGATTGDIGETIQRFVERHGYSVVREFIGHGVGRALHELPEVPNFGKKGKGHPLLPGMTIAIEPIVTMGKRYIEVLADGWTAITKDRSIACQVEHTVLVTSQGSEILTRE